MKAIWHKVNYTSSDNVKLSDFFFGETPAESMANAKKVNHRCKHFRVCKTAYNTFGEKIK